MQDEGEVMAKQLTDTEIQVAAMLKTARNTIRLKYSLMADREIAELLPKFERQIHQAIMEGRPIELAVGEVTMTEGSE